MTCNLELIIQIQKFDMFSLYLALMVWPETLNK